MCYSLIPSHVNMDLVYELRSSNDESMKCGACVCTEICFLSINPLSLSTSALRQPAEPSVTPTNIQSVLGVPIC